MGTFLRRGGSSKKIFHSCCYIFFIYLFIRRRGRRSREVIELLQDCVVAIIVIIVWMVARWSCAVQNPGTPGSNLLQSNCGVICSPPRVLFISLFFSFKVLFFFFLVSNCILLRFSLAALQVLARVHS